MLDTIIINTIGDDLSEHTIYPNAPVIEVLCGLAVTSPNSLTDEIVCAFKNDVVEILPVYSEEKQEKNEPGQFNKKYHFANQEDTVIVTLFNDGIEFHIINSYSSVDKLYALLNRIYDAYNKARVINGLKFCQLGYLNKILIPEKTINLSDYFTFTPVPNKVLVDFIVGYEFEDEFKFRTSISLTPTKSESENEVTFILDVRSATPNEIDSYETFSNILHRVHDNIEAEFESAVTDKTRELFQAKL